jgi:phage-related protein
MTWVVETYGPVVDREIEQLPADMQVALLDLLGRIEIAGPAELPRKSAKHLEGKLWELRITGRDGIARAIYITLSGRRLTLLRVFIKKTQKTPPGELETARRRMNALLQRP